MGFSKYFNHRKMMPVILTSTILLGATSFLPTMSYRASAGSNADPVIAKIKQLPSVKKIMQEPGYRFGAGSWDQPYERVWINGPADSEGIISESETFLFNRQTAALYAFDGHDIIKDKIFVSTDDKFFSDGILADDHVFVPLRGIFDNYGAQLDWNGANQTVSIVYQGKTIELHIGNASAEVNGDTVQIDQAPRIVEGRTMIPVRFVSETLGWQVFWEPEQNLVALVSPGHKSKGQD